MYLKKLSGLFSGFRSLMLAIQQIKTTGHKARPGGNRIPKSEPTLLLVLQIQSF